MPAEREVLEVSGRTTVVVWTGDTRTVEEAMVGFSCSSKRTMSRTCISVPVRPLRWYEEQATGDGPVTPSRQILKLVLNAPVPPWMKRAAHVDGSGWRRSIVRTAWPT